MLGRCVKYQNERWSFYNPVVGKRRCFDKLELGRLGIAISNKNLADQRREIFQDQGALVSHDYVWFLNSSTGFGTVMPDRADFASIGVSDDRTGRSF